MTAHLRHATDNQSNTTAYKQNYILKSAFKKKTP